MIHDKVPIKGPQFFSLIVELHHVYIQFFPILRETTPRFNPPKKSSPVLFASEVRTVNFTTSVVEEPWPPATLFQKQVGPRF